MKNVIQSRDLWEQSKDLTYKYSLLQALLPKFDQISESLPKGKTKTELKNLMNKCQDEYEIEIGDMDIVEKIFEMNF